MMAEHLVIGIGNPDRTDDAAGVLVARKVHQGRVLEWADCSVLMDLWDSADDVIVVDAMRSGLPPGTVRRFDAVDERLPARAFPSTHSMGIAETVELARALGRLPLRLTVYGIEAGDLSLGGTPGDEVTAAVDRVAEEINEELGGC
jgi:hydrogenase maturation protease